MATLKPDEVVSLSLGMGVQSVTLAAKVALGHLPPVDFMAHADTSFEMRGTYEYASWFIPWLEERGQRVIVVKNEAQAAKAGTAKTDLPAFTMASGSKGQLRRQCTGRWKIVPIRRALREVMAEKGVSIRSRGKVKQWLGISLDEIERARPSDVRYIENVYPLLDLGMTRADCIAYLKAQGLPVPGKSSCTFCPYHNKAAWADLKRQGGPDWEQALEIDKAIRDTRPPYSLFVHPSCIPLAEAVVIPEDWGAEQLGFPGVDPNTPCDSGFCFL